MDLTSEKNGPINRWVGLPDLETLKKSGLTVRDINRPGGEVTGVPVMKEGDTWWILGANDQPCQVTDKLILQQIVLIERMVSFGS